MTYPMAVTCSLPISVTDTEAGILVSAWQLVSTCVTLADTVATARSSLPVSGLPSKCHGVEHDGSSSYADRYLLTQVGGPVSNAAERESQVSLTFPKQASALLSCGKTKVVPLDVCARTVT
jgi:hypothetical protein